SISTVCLLFFFSSRRRHTRFSRDWSSDVCSSDLPAALDVGARVDDLARLGHHPLRHRRLGFVDLPAGPQQDGEGGDEKRGQPERSEERRVGKECRTRWTAYESKKKRRRDRRGEIL